MALFRVEGAPEADITIADGIAAHTGRPAEHIAQTLTWGADEQCFARLRSAGGSTHGPGTYRCDAQAIMYW